MVSGCQMLAWRASPNNKGADQPAHTRTSDRQHCHSLIEGLSYLDLLRQNFNFLASFFYSVQKIVVSR